MSEEERQALAELVASSIDRLGITEVAKITGVADTSLRKYATEGLQPGIRAKTVAGIRRLGTHPPVPDPPDDAVLIPRALFEDLRDVLEALEAQGRGEHGDEPRLRTPPGGVSRNPGTGNRRKVSG